MFDPFLGVVNYGFSLLGMGPSAFYGAEETAMWSIIAVDVWWQTAFVFIIMLAGLRGLPRDPIEAAQVEGAGDVAIFWRIKFPLLRSLLIKPIQKLNQAAKEIGRGKLLVPISVDTRDEIGDLATTFKEMGENLNHYHEQVHYIAYHDSLTGLPNRLMFKDYLKRATAEARRNLQELSILFLDLDNFKRINDTLGHIAGDKLLEAFADRLQSCLRETDIISHSPTADSSESVMARLAGELGVQTRTMVLLK